MEDNIIKSFIVKDTLNPKVWDSPNDVKKAKMKPKIKKGLLDIEIIYISETKYNLEDKNFYEQKFFLSRASQIFFLPNESLVVKKNET